MTKSITRTVASKAAALEADNALALAISNDLAAADAKARNSNADRQRDVALSMASQQLVFAGKEAAKAMAKADAIVSNAGRNLMQAFYEEGEHLAQTQLDYAEDMAPIVTLAIAEAYPKATDASRKTWRAYAKVFFLAGRHAIKSNKKTISALTEDYRDQLKALGALESHANDKPKQTRQARTAAAKPQADQTPANPQSTPAAPTFQPGKVYTEADLRQAALVLDGSPAFAPKIVKAFLEHREQMHKFIDSILAD